MQLIKLTNFGRTKRYHNKESPKRWCQKTRKERISICTSRRLSNHTVSAIAQHAIAKHTTNSFFFVFSLFLLFCVFPIALEIALDKFWNPLPIALCSDHSWWVSILGQPCSILERWISGPAVLGLNWSMVERPHWTDCKWVVLSRSRRVTQGGSSIPPILQWSKPPLASIALSLWWWECDRSGTTGDSVHSHSRSAKKMFC